MKASKIRELTLSELLEREKELKSELFNLRFQQATGELTNPMRIRECKKDIARVKTIMHQRSQESSQAVSLAAK